MAKKWLQFPVISAGAEHLVMGHLMRRNILAYEAPPRNEGYDLICIHPDPRHKRKRGKKAQVRVQVKSRYATDCGRAFPVKEVSLDAFDFLIVAFLNIGRFSAGKDGSTGAAPVEFYTLPRSFVCEHHHKGKVWQRVRLRPLEAQIQKYKDEAGFELIAKALGIPQPTRSE